VLGVLTVTYVRTYIFNYTGELAVNAIERSQRMLAFKCSFLPVRVEQQISEQQLNVCHYFKPTECVICLIRLLSTHPTLLAVSLL